MNRWDRNEAKSPLDSENTLAALDFLIQDLKAIIFKVKKLYDIIHLQILIF